MATDNHTPKLNGSAVLPVPPKPVNTFSDYGREIEEIVSTRPPYFVRWGTVYFLLLLLCIGFICWMIRYPEVVLAKATLNSINAPRHVITRSDGKLVKIVVKANEEVKADAVLAYMESTASPFAVHQLGLQIDSMNNLLSKQRSDELDDFYPDHDDRQQFMGSLGELQSAYQSFMQSFTVFRDFLSSGFFLRKKKMLLSDLGNLHKQYGILQSQKVLLEQDLQLTDENFKANESLVKDKVISAGDYRNERSKLIAKQLMLPQVNASIVANEALQNEKKKEIAELENQIIVQKSAFVQALQTLKSQVQAWELKYLLKAPVAGKVTFNGFFQENQEMKSGQSLFYVFPGNTEYFTEMLIPQYNFGKVRHGQQVLLKFQAYPSGQFGAVYGKIDVINATPTDSGYQAKVVLPDGLNTNYNKTLQYQNGLTAEANILTQDMRLIERFYYNIRKQFSR